MPTDGGVGDAVVPPIAEPPAVLFFEAAPKVITTGGSSLLTWQTVRATAVAIDGVQAALDSKGTFEVSPADTTRYVLTAEGPGGIRVASATVSVAAPGAVIVRTFVAEPSTVRRGEPVRLRWQVDNASDIDIVPDNPLNPSFEDVPPAGTVTFTPAGTIVYTLIATGAGTTAQASVTARVQVPPPRIQRFTATPATFTTSQMVTLQWAATDASRASIGGLGPQPVTGSAVVQPARATAYQLDVVGVGGIASAVVEVAPVQPGAPRIVELSVLPRHIDRGMQSTLRWQIDGAFSYSISQGVAPSAPVGERVVTPAVTTTYVATAVSPGGTTAATTTLVVDSGDGDTCADAVPLTDSGTVSGDTRTAAADYNPGRAGCTGFDAFGPDNVYRVSLQAGERLIAELTPRQPMWDAALYLVRGCEDVASSCVAGDDSGTSESIDYTADAGGDYFLVVDGFRNGGPYVLSTEVRATPLSNDRCADAINLPGNGLITGSTAGASGDYDPGSGGCTRAAASGADVVYSVQLQARERLQASLHAGFDSSLYVVTDCGDVLRSCVAGSDDGDPEEVDFVAQVAGRYYLIIDGYGSGSGAFELSVQVSPPASGGDTCGAAITVPAGGGAFMSSTAGMGNDYEPPLSCTGSTNQGADVAYRLDARAGEVIEVQASFSDSDGALYAVTDCGDLASCVAGAASGGRGADERLRFVARSSQPYYVVVDGVLAGDAGAHDIAIDRHSGATCAFAAPLRTDATSEWLTTAGFADDYSPGAAGCTGRPTTGPDRVYGVDLGAGDQLQVRLDGLSFDAAMYLLSDCADPRATCVDGVDRQGAVEVMAPVVQQPGSYFLVVDGVDGASGEGEIAALIARGDTCAQPYGVPSSGGRFTGTTTGYGADYGIDRRAGSCTGWEQTGADAVYRISLNPGQRLSASVEAAWDTSLYLITDCARSATTCLTGEDNGDPETLTYSNQTAGPRTYYLIVDGYRSTASGNYTLEIQIQ